MLQAQAQVDGHVGEPPQVLSCCSDALQCSGPAGQGAAEQLLVAKRSRHVLFCRHTAGCQQSFIDHASSGPGQSVDVGDGGPPDVPPQAPAQLGLDGQVVLDRPDFKAWQVDTRVVMSTTAVLSKFMLGSPVSGRSELARPRRVAAQSQYSPRP